jgi:hypothetical protein
MADATAPLRERIDAMIGAGRPLERIESDVIDPAALSDEQRAVLWLYAWTCREGEGEHERRVPYTPAC